MEQTTSIQEKHRLFLQNSAIEEKTQLHVDRAISELQEITRKYTLFHISFFAIACLQLLSFVLFFSFLTKSTMLAFSIAGIFLTAFAYFVLLFYLQAKKPEQLLAVRLAFLEHCELSVSCEKNSADHHRFLSLALYQLIASLKQLEYSYYSLPNSFKTLSPLMKKFSAWCHWKDLYQIKEMLFQTIIQKNIELVKIAPTDLETHAGLANAYISLSELYQDPRKVEPEQDHIWIAPDYFSSEFLEKFKNASWRAIEEFKILDTYAPHDPWIHAQLAAIYHNLHNSEEEIRAYESILKVAPHNRDILLRLGVLYFRHGHPAQGLRLYEQLKKTNDGKAEELISYYDAYEFV